MSAAPWTIVVPLLGAVLALLVPTGAWTRRVAIGAVGMTVASAAILASEVWRHGAARYPVGGWSAPLGIELQVDGLAAMATLVAAAVMLALSAFAVPYFAAHGGRTGWRSEDAFWPLWLLLLVALQALFLSADAWRC